MRSDAVVIISIGFQNSAQMRLAQDNDVVHTLTPDRSDQPFGKAILPGRGWCSRLVPDAHGAQSARDDAAIDSVAIADEVVRRLIPGTIRPRILTVIPVRRSRSQDDGQHALMIYCRPLGYRNFWVDTSIRKTGASPSRTSKLHRSPGRRAS